jgi:hypothetical protein
MKNKQFYFWPADNSILQYHNNRMSLIFQIAPRMYDMLWGVLTTPLLKNLLGHFAHHQEASPISWDNSFKLLHEYKISIHVFLSIHNICQYTQKKNKNVAIFF